MYCWIESSRPCSKEVMTRILTPCQGRNRIQRRCEHRCKIERKGRTAGRVGLKKKFEYVRAPRKRAGGCQVRMIDKNVEI